MGIIYLARNTVNDKVYVGMTTRTLSQRKAEHHLCSKKNNNFYFANAIRKYGWNTFHWRVLDTFDTLDEGIEKETRWIDITLSNVKPLGYNTTGGGEGRHSPLSEDAKRKMSIAHTGMVMPEQTRRKIALSNKGKHQQSFQCLQRFHKKRTEETICKIEECVKAHPDISIKELLLLSGVSKQTLYNYINRNLIKKWR